MGSFELGTIKINMNKVLVAFFFLVFVSCSEKIKIKEQSKSIVIEDSELINYLFEGATGNNPGANVLVVLTTIQQIGKLAIKKNPNSNLLTNAILTPALYN